MDNGNDDKPWLQLRNSFEMDLFRLCVFFLLVITRTLERVCRPIARLITTRKDLCLRCSGKRKGNLTP